MKIATLIIGGLIAIGVAWTTRWEITPIPNGDGLGRAYMLNRWTGTVYLLFVDTQIEVTKEK